MRKRRRKGRKGREVGEGGWGGYEGKFNKIPLHHKMHRYSNFFYIILMKTFSINFWKNIQSKEAEQLYLVSL